jgi:putative nucleotidyltransferase with HDIG domain
MTLTGHESVREELLWEARKMRLIPSLNTITSQMLQVINDKNSSYNELYSVARYDQGFSGKIISIANSAFYSRGIKIVSLQRALQVIGIDALRSILICLTLLQDILGQFKLRQKDLVALWTHSLEVSCGARILSSKQMVEYPDEVFTVAILHDIGKGVFYTRGDRYHALVKEAKDTGMDLCVLERAVFGIDHQEVGDFIARRWRFPEELGAVIRGHHEVLDGGNMLISLVQAADAFMENRKIDLGAQRTMLEKEKESINAEVRKVSELLGVCVG